MIQTFTLIVIMCMPGAWSECSSGLKDMRIEHLPSKEACEQVAAIYRKKLNFKETDPWEKQSATCIPVMENSK